MKKLFTYSFAAITLFFFLNIGNVADAQAPGICKNVQKCNDQNFSASEDDDHNAGEFYNSMNDDGVNVVLSEYTGDDHFARAFFGKSQPSDGYGIGARFEAGFCAIEAFTITGGTNPSSPPPGPPANLFGTFTAAIGGGPNTVSFGLVGAAGGIDASTVNIGVYGFTHDFGVSALNYSGFFEGDVFVGGTLINPSDNKLKQNSKRIENSLDKLRQLKAKSYEYRTEEYSYMNLPKGEQYGFIAQELAEVYPHLVSDNVLPATDPRRTELPQHGSVEFKGINYIGMIPIMVEAINEQTAIIEEKDQRISELESQLDRLTSRISAIEAKLNLDNDQPNKPSMKQNQPNPTNGSTSIEYFIPDNVETAFIKVYNVSGKEVQSYFISDRGDNTIEIDMKGYPTASYFYSLFVDGMAVDTKKMMINRLD